MSRSPGRTVRDALGYPRRDREHVLTTVLLGGVLTFLAFLVVPQILLLGYFVRVLRGTARGDEAPPRFDRWRALLVDGTKAYVIWLAWTAVPLLVRFGLSGGHLEPGQATFWLLGWMLAPNAVSLLQRGSESTGLLEGFGFTEPYVDLLIVLYILPAAMANFAHAGTIRSGFFQGGFRRYLDWVFGLLEPLLPGVAGAAKRLLDRLVPAPEFEHVRTLTTRRYAVAWLGYFALYLAGEAVLRFTLLLPTGGGWLIPLVEAYLFVALLAFFYLRVEAWSIVGRAWPDVAPEGSVTTDGPPAVDPPRNLRGSRLAVVLGGGLLTSFSIVLVFPALLVAGYLVRVLRSSANESLPAFEEPRRLLVDGTKAYAVWFGYLVVPLTLLYISASGTLLAGNFLGDLVAWGALAGVGLPGGFPAFWLFLVGSFALMLLLSVALLALPSPLVLLPIAVMRLPLSVAVALVLLAAYVVPAALLRLAGTGSLRAAFAVRALRPTLRRRSYAARWLAAVALTLPGWAALLAATVAVAHPVMGGAPLAEPIAGLAYLTFFVGPTSIPALLWWVAILLSGVAYFWLLLVACRVLGRVGATP